MDNIFYMTFGHNYNINDDNKFMVYTDDVNKMNIFTKQHYFDLNLLSIKMIDDDLDLEDVDMLKLYKFKSNKNPDESFHIYTTQRIVESCIIETTSHLIETLKWSKLCSRDDIGFIRTINELTERLPHALPIPVDLDTTPYDYTDLIDMEDYISQTFELESSSAYADNGYYQTITIEAYIKNFINIMTTTNYYSTLY